MPGDSAYIYFNIWNNEHSGAKLLNVLALPYHEGFTLSDEKNITRGGPPIQLPESYRIRLDYQPPELGTYTMILIFEFEGFRICRQFVANIENDIISSLKPTAPYTPKKYTRDETPRKILEGEPPSASYIFPLIFTYSFKGVRK